jgi:hypothetical protein
VARLRATRRVSHTHVRASVNLHLRKVGLHLSAGCAMPHTVPGCRWTRSNSRCRSGVVRPSGRLATGDNNLFQLLFQQWLLIVFTARRRNAVHGLWHGSISPARATRLHTLHAQDRRRWISRHFGARLQRMRPKAEWDSTLGFPGEGPAPRAPDHGLQEGPAPRAIGPGLQACVRCLCSRLRSARPVDDWDATLGFPGEGPPGNGLTIDTANVTTWRFCVASIG